MGLPEKFLLHLVHEGRLRLLSLYVTLANILVVVFKVRLTVGVILDLDIIWKPENMR